MFTGIGHTFSDRIDWDFAEHGRLWTYNLNYFDFLMQPGISRETGIKLMKDFIAGLHYRAAGLESYPVSLRGINWIKFISAHQINDKQIIDSLYSHYRHLCRNIEYHLSGNHLLENGFSLLFGGCFFQERLFIIKAENILRRELNEQVLSDGGHFELSPMYHQIILHRLLDCICMLGHLNGEMSDLLTFMREKAAVMTAWLHKISWKDGSIPMLNDSAPGIAPTSGELFEYARRLAIQEEKKNSLSDSGYRRYVEKEYEAVVDVGKVGPDYIPGHAHADIFHFEVRMRGIPFLVDTGTSTYENNHIRHNERSTWSHNTVVVNNKNQSDVWGSHRVGKRASVTILEESAKSVYAQHNGYRSSGITHHRMFSFHTDRLDIMDELTGQPSSEGVALFHFAPGINPVLEGNRLITPEASLVFMQPANIKINDYLFASGFNSRVNAKMAAVTFRNKLRTTIHFEDSVSH
jgi:uncharacterized heparinase superfamily protein